MIARIRTSGPFLALGLLLVLVFLLGGSARADVGSLIVLRPVAIMLLGYGLWGLQWEQIGAHRFLFAMAVAAIALVLVQLIPLPPEIWMKLPGRELVAEIDRAAGLGALWRPISLAPAATWNAFYALLVPIAVLVLGARLPKEQLFQLLPLVILLGLSSALLGLLQVIGPADGPLYFYRITNQGAAVGLFANRNHQALLLAMMFPMLAVYALSARREAARASRRMVAAVLVGVFLVPLILVTGSRSGLLAAVIALASIGLMARRPREEKLAVQLPRNSRRAGLARNGLLVLLVAILAILTIWLGRGIAYERLLATGPEDELRLQIVPTLLHAIRLYFPAGSGIGSFEPVYQLHEPDALLSGVYMNHAHNDWLEVLLTGGLAGLVLMLTACIGAVTQGGRALARQDGDRRSVLHARLGVVMLLLAGLASISDYPLRVPSLSCLMILASLWTSSLGWTRDGQPTVR